MSSKLLFGFLGVCFLLIFLLFLWNFAISTSKARQTAANSKTKSQASIANKISWSPGPDAPIAMMEGPCIQVGNKLFVMGGFTRGLHVTQEANVLDLDAMRWSPIPPLPQSQTHVGIATDEKYLYLVGGQFGPGKGKNIRAEAFRYDIANKVWSDFTPLPEPRLGGELVYLDGYLHYFGGDTNDRVTVSNKHWAIPVSGKGGWVEKAPLIHPGDHIGACVLNGKIYSLGGEHDHGFTYVQHDAVSQYDPETNKWTPKAPLPAASSHFEAGVLVIHGRTVVMGGQPHSKEYSADIRIYDPTTNSWAIASALPRPLKGGATAFYKDRLYYVSGRGPAARSWKYSWVGKIENPWW